MYSIAIILIALITGGFCATDPHRINILAEPAFGMEFSTEHIMISFVAFDGHPKELAAVKGDKAYHFLMESWYELSYWTYASQTPPWTHQDCREIVATGKQTRTILRPDINWFDWYEFQTIDDIDTPQIFPELDEQSNYTDINILADAIRSVKKAAADILASQYNTTMPDRPLVSIAAPSFLWTTRPQSGLDDVYPDCGPESDEHFSNWHHVLWRKMSDAVHRAGFRRQMVENIDATMQAAACQNHTSPIAPAGYAAFWNPEFQAGANATAPNPSMHYGNHYEGQPAVVLELTNMAVSAWAQQEGPIYSPWSTWPQWGLGQNTDLPAFMRHPDDPVWSDVVSMVRRLRTFLDCPDGEILRLYLIVDAWEDEIVDAFETYLQYNEHTDTDMEFRGMFSASNGAASVSRQMLDACTEI